MKKHPYRTLLIWAALIVALVNIYPTIGWMLLPDDKDWLDLPESERLLWQSLSQEERAQDENRDKGPKPGRRQERMIRWQEEDDERAREKHGLLDGLWYRTKRWAQFDRDMVINLGLDLQGGIHMVLRFDFQEMPADKLQAYRDGDWSDSDLQERIQETVLQQIRRRIHDFEAKEPIIQTLGPNQIQVQLPGEKDIERAKRLIMKAAVLNFHIVAGRDETVAVFSKVKDRFPNQFMPFIKRPSATNPQFRVPGEHFDRVNRLLKKVQATGDIIPEGKEVRFSETPKPYEPQEYELYLLDEEPIASGEGLQRAAATPDDRNPPYWQIVFRMNNAAGAQFGEATEANKNRAMAIVLDNVVVSAPVIKDRITTDGQITGKFEGPEASDLAIALNSGSMVVPIHEEFTRVVGASLGADSVRKGVISAVAGILIVGAFMLVYYLGAGVVALGALAFNAVVVIAAMAYFGMTLTLPGIAGLILTVGMAVDANVLIFERIREELNLGHSLISSVENGFARATVTILDANVTTLIAAAVLMQFGTGPIEGFAVTLSIGVCSSVFCALIVSRALIDFGVNRNLISKLRMFSILRSETKLPFLEARLAATLISVAAIAIGSVMFGFRWSEESMFGVDFTQGTNVQLSINSEEFVPVESVRVALAQAGFDSPVVQRSGRSTVNTNEFIIRVGDVNEMPASAAAKTDSPEAAPSEQAPAGETSADAPAAEEAPAGEEAAADTAETEKAAEVPQAANAEDGDTAPAMQGATVAERIQAACASLTQRGASEEIEILDEQTVGPAVGAQLRWDAFKSMFYALLFIIVYLWIRFEFKFAVGAVVALVHDVLVTVGVFALLGRQITMPVVAALLTIIGYSLNDTIVVFDRIREDLGLYRGKGYKFIDILNIAINATLSRTLLTSMTTLFVVVVLYLFGGDAINDFALALILGVVVGTYSSIFIASPVVYFIQHRILGKTALPTDTGKGGDTEGKGKKANKGQGGSKSKTHPGRARA